MRMLFLAAIATSLLLLSSCKKDKFKSCDFDACDDRRATIFTAQNWTGTLGYYNDLRQWAVNYSVPNTIDSVLTCIICGDIPDSLKQIGTRVMFSGKIKDGCGSPKPSFYGQGVFYIKPTMLK